MSASTARPAGGLGHPRRADAGADRADGVERGDAVGQPERGVDRRGVGLVGVGRRGGGERQQPRLVARPGTAARQRRPARRPSTSCPRRSWPRCAPRARRRCRALADGRSLQPPVGQVGAVADDPSHAARWYGHPSVRGHPSAWCADVARLARHSDGYVAGGGTRLPVRPGPSTARSGDSSCTGPNGSTPCRGSTSSSSPRRRGGSTPSAASRSSASPAPGGRSAPGSTSTTSSDPDPDLPMREVGDLGRIMAEAVTDMRALTVVGVHGRCVGGGVVLAAACDLRVAADDAVFSIPEVELGIPLAWAGIPRLVREIGPALTKELVLTCRPFSPAEAAAFGFVNRVVPAARSGRRGRRPAAPAGEPLDADADGDQGPRQRRRRGDGVDGQRPPRRRRPGVGAARPREPGGRPLPTSNGWRRIAPPARVRSIAGR